MLRHAIVAVLLIAACWTTTNAQDPLALLSQYDGNSSQIQERSPSDILPPDVIPSDGMTPEIWLYLQQLRRYDDPKQAVRRRAEMRADQRHNRIETRKWFGLSNIRPTANSTPFLGTYSPHWSSGNSNSFRWSGGGVPVYSAGLGEPVPRR